MIASYYRSKI